MVLPLNFVLNTDGTYDVDGSVKITKDMVKNGKLLIRFNKVKGNFSCNNVRLVSLIGSPKVVGGYFDCSCNKLSSLEGSPNVVGGEFNCISNRLTSLRGCTRIIKGNFYCSSNELPSLEGCPISVGGDFCCGYNIKKFIEEEARRLCNIKGNFICSWYIEYSDFPTDISDDSDTFECSEINDYTWGEIMKVFNIDNSTHKNNIISEDDIIDLKIILNLSGDVSDFINQI